ncbi:hypothetical protein ACQ4M3_30915 [Leptolyngbya sp. AN03gr2]
MPEISRFFGMIITMYSVIRLHTFQHQAELLQIWKLARENAILEKIEPLE